MELRESVYAFLTVKSADSLVARLIKMGYDIDETAEIKSGQDEGFAIGIKDGLAIIIAKDEDFDGKKALDKAFSMTVGDVSGWKGR